MLNNWKFSFLWQALLIPNSEVWIQYGLCKYICINVMVTFPLGSGGIMVPNIKHVATHQRKLNILSSFVYIYSFDMMMFVQKRECRPIPHDWNNIMLQVLSHIIILNIFAWEKYLNNLPLIKADYFAPRHNTTFARYIISFLARSV